ncbi:MAG: DUF167 domain-containing protein [Patescibacteria group bacterium]
MYIWIKVTPGAKKELFEQKSEDHFVANVREKAERNMANMRVRELVAAHFGVPVGKARIISGHTSPSKILSVDAK